MPKVLSAVRALLFGSAGSQAVAVGVSGDTDPRLRIDAGGRLTWGTGAAAGDIYVERNGVNALLVSGELLADSYQVDVAATPTGAVGKLIWNDTEGTLDLGLKGGNVTLPVGQAVTQMVSNVTGSNMTRGQVIRLSGAQGNRTTVALATAATEEGSSKTFGVTAEAINDNHSGIVITEGLLMNLNTSSLTEGSIVWLSAATAGGMTTTKPSAPNHGVMVGLCVKSHASTGILLVKVQNGYELEELHNVSITTPSDGQVLTYDAALALWKNANATGGGGASVSVGDTAPASPSEGDLWFNSDNLKTYIYYDSYWVEVGGGAGGGGSSFTVSDTAPTSPATGDVWYDSTTGKHYIYYDLFWVEMATSNALSVSSHGSTHIRGGNDVIDGDRLQVDYVPTRYSRNAAASGAGATTDLAAHLGGLDNQLLYGMLTFTNEAARDAAITTPLEGMSAYLTAPTVPAATGNTTTVPTGIQTIYNGTAWVCVTEVGAYTDGSLGVATSASYTTTGSGSHPNPTVTLSTGSTALVSFSAACFNNSSAFWARLSVGVTGASTITSDTALNNWNENLYTWGNASALPWTASKTFVIFGLTPGINTFSLRYLNANANTANFTNRFLTVKGLL